MKNKFRANITATQPCSPAINVCTFLKDKILQIVCPKMNPRAQIKINEVSDTRDVTLMLYRYSFIPYHSAQSHVFGVFFYRNQKLRNATYSLTRVQIHASGAGDVGDVRASK